MFISPSHANCVITRELDARPSREHHPDLHGDVLMVIAAAMNRGRDAVLKVALLIVLELTRGTTAAISIVHKRLAGDLLVWEGTAGSDAELLQGELPFYSGPCGYALEVKDAQLFADPSSHFDSIPLLVPPILEMLVVPVFDSGQPWGALAVCMSGHRKLLDREDARQLKMVGEYTMAALAAMERLPRCYGTAHQFRQ